MRGIPVGRVFNPSHTERLVHLAALTLLLTCCGCAGWKAQLSPKGVAPQRQQRHDDAVREFEEHRDAAQMQAALDRWQQGDAAGCEARLQAIVQRRPDYTDARLHLAEVLWARGEAAAAEPHLQAVLARQPERAEAHHALGMLLGATGRSDEARHHLARAAELEPENDVYRLTCESLPSTAWGLRDGESTTGSVNAEFQVPRTRYSDFTARK